MNFNVVTTSLETQSSSNDNSQNTEITEISKQLAALTKQLKKKKNFKRNQFRGRRDSQSNYRNRSRSKSGRRRADSENEGSSDMCWYHSKFGKKAHKCLEP